MTEVFIGVDVSMDWIDVFDPERGTLRIENVPRKLAAFARSVERRGVTQVVFEATGGYDALLRAALEEAGTRFARVNPGKARHFAHAFGVIGKTDRVDARMLSEMGRRFDLPDTEPLCPVRRELKELAARRRQLVEIRKQENTRLQQTAARAIRTSIKLHLRQLDVQIKRLEKAIGETIDTNSDLAGVFKRLCTAPGVGFVTAITLIAELAELGTLCRRKIAALAGLAPIAKDTGKQSPKRKIGGGRPVVRTALYMAAMQTRNCDPRMKAFHDRLREGGLEPKQAIIAVARKLLTALNAMIRNDKDFEICPI